MEQGSDIVEMEIKYNCRLREKPHGEARSKTLESGQKFLTTRSRSLSLLRSARVLRTVSQDAPRPLEEVVIRRGRGRPPGPNRKLHDDMGVDRGSD